MKKICILGTEKSGRTSLLRHILKSSDDFIPHFAFYETHNQVY